MKTVLWITYIETHLIETYSWIITTMTVRNESSEKCNRGLNLAMNTDYSNLCHKCRQVVKGMLLATRTASATTNSAIPVQQLTIGLYVASLVDHMGRPIMPGLTLAHFPWTPPLLPPLYTRHRRRIASSFGQWSPPPSTTDGLTAVYHHHCHHHHRC